jgi:hypothetical protein
MTVASALAPARRVTAASLPSLEGA